MLGRGRNLAQSRTKPAIQPVTSAVSQQAVLPASCPAFCLWFKNTSFTALIFSKPLVTFFLTVPETLMLGRKLGVQDTYMLLLVGAISGKMIKTIVTWISNLGLFIWKKILYSDDLNSLRKDLEWESAILQDPESTFVLQLLFGVSQIWVRDRLLQSHLGYSFKVPTQESEMLVVLPRRFGSPSYFSIHSSRTSLFVVVLVRNLWGSSKG